MGKKQIEAFYQKLMEDKDLKGQVTAIKGNADEVYDKIAKTAKGAGFDVTPEDVKEYLANEQLADEELDKVAGGASGCTSVCSEVCGLHLGHWMGRQ